MPNFLSGLSKTVKEILSNNFCATVSPSAVARNIFSKIMFFTSISCEFQRSYLEFVPNL